jgi:hypothetical protein
MSAFVPLLGEKRKSGELTQATDFMSTHPSHRRFIRAVAVNLVGPVGNDLAALHAGYMAKPARNLL